MELLRDLDMHLYVERGVRGGVNQCCNRYAYANNKYMSGCDPNEESRYLMYDVDNLYGWAMIESLPYSDFECVENLKNIDVLNVADDSSIGYILEVDLEYPVDIHDRHKDLPLCPEHKSAPGSTQKKLMTTVDSKSDYILHWTFDKRPWLKP